MNNNASLEKLYLDIDNSSNPALVCTFVKSASGFTSQYVNVNGQQCIMWTKDDLKMGGMEHDFGYKTAVGISKGDFRKKASYIGSKEKTLNDVYDIKAFNDIKNYVPDDFPIDKEELLASTKQKDYTFVLSAMYKFGDRENIRQEVEKLCPTNEVKHIVSMIDQYTNSLGRTFDK